jgi:chromate reductase, NAD(P)H dehydrogenase (quinone)
VSSAANVVVLVGSLRKESLNRKIANALIALNTTPLKFAFAEIGNLPLYNQDLDGENAPAHWVSFRQQVGSADAVLFLTPEYNRSLPGCLKNALDVGSRPYGKSAWEGKPGAIISVAPGALGAFGANHHLRQCLVFLNVPAMQQPEAYIGGADKLLDAEGRLINESTREFLGKFVKAFAVWIEATRKR